MGNLRKGKKSSKENHLIKRKASATYNLVTPNKPILFDSDVCNGCNICVDACPIDVLIPNPEKGEVPLLLFPDECWHCGCCQMACPLYEKGAIVMNFPLMQRVRWKRKKTGEHFRLGMKNPPPSNTKPPV